MIAQRSSSTMQGVHHILLLSSRAKPKPKTLSQPLIQRRTSSSAAADSPERERWERPFTLHRARGQHLLASPRALDAVARRAGVGPGDTVLEVGPGTGNLTVRLLALARRVVAVEVDPRMVDALRDRVSRLGLLDRLTVISGDAMKTEFPEFDLCVANIPYGISSPLIGKLLFGPCHFRSATLLLQKEFARRLVSVPGDSEYNRLAANVRLVANVELLMDVSKKDFIPCPKVDSSLVKIRPKAEVPAVDLDEWLAFTRTCFSKKNKTLGAIFKQKKKIIELFRRSHSERQEDNRRVNGGCDDLDDDGEDDDDGYARSKIEEKVGEDASEVSLFKKKIVGILNAGGFGEKRPSKLSNEELLHLLQLLNQEGVLFH
ncbi:ribosomal RNA small subunit methyltransferase, mitochondrial [Ananas comosus]|uniref:rRNA adenine N(6)-methyltransferase n=1 Tax=Ananas comosus TaxID=4615 RepID=A0A6P5FQT1_ANACO|nr:ribosomal RNA small subunit methyltransferase, mitochondrial [Ananas comosus]